MISGLKPKQLLYRDGTAQDKRQMAALDPGYINMDERSVGDLIGFAKEFAKELNFFDEDNKPAGTWEGFLTNDIEVGDIIAYIEAPDKFLGDFEKMRKLSRPHLILFVSFLQLLEHIKDQLNGFTKKHLDFYYGEILGLSKKKPVPDVVNVIVQLADNVGEFFIEKGTELLAGKDSLGKDLVYKTDKDATVSEARVQNIKTLFVEKKITDIETARKDNLDDKDRGLTKMLELALGDPLPGGKLPKYKEADVDYAKFKVIYDLFVAAGRNVQTEEYKYLTEKLFLVFRPHDESKIIINTAENVNASEADWEIVYEFLDRAYKAKVKQNRQQLLKGKHKSEADTKTGFYKMLELALGNPNPGDKLPAYKNTAADLGVLLALNKSLEDKDAERSNALEYVTEELLLTEADFTFCINTYKNNNAKEEDWQKVYAVVEAAGRKKRSFGLPSPVIEEWLNVYGVNDAKASAFSVDEGADVSTVRFNTFGKGKSSTELGNATPANIGFAVASPQLLLTEGRRKIILTLAFKPQETIPVNEIKKILPDIPGGAKPFLFFTSNSKEWKSLNAERINYGNFVVSDAGEEIKTATINGGIITSTVDIFKKEDEGKYIVWNDGKIYLINVFSNSKSVTATLGGTTYNQPGIIRKYNTTDVYFNAMQVELNLDENDPPVDAPGTGNDYMAIKSPFPVIGMVLNNIITVAEAKTPYINLYQQFKNLQLEKVKVKVTASDLKVISLENDNSVLDYKKPFEPFGFNPETGNSLYFAHPEICNKRLDTITLNFQWMKPPADFTSYYLDYSRIALGKMTLGFPGEYKVSGNETFKADLKLSDNNARIPLETISLFKKDDARVENSVSINVPQAIAKNRPGHNYGRSNVPDVLDDVVSLKRYFSLELGITDFQQAIYPSLLTRQALITPDPTKQTVDETQLRKLVLNPPYTPKLKTFTLGYTASFEIDLINGKANTDDNIFHINAFGHKQLKIGNVGSSSKNTYFLPYFKNEGELYIGLSNLKLPQNLSILFQMAEGSADPDLDLTPVEWSYLSNNEWLELKGNNVVSDTTNGLQNTGIIEFNIPINATANNTLLSSGMHWLRATISNDTDAVPDTVDIIAQAISAGFSDNENAADHLLNFLPAESIKQTLVRIREIKKIDQPFTSSKGSPAEVNHLFYNRVSERLRHKNRALTMWDYERIILEKFPEVYKAKCLPADFSGRSSDAGKVDVIVIPDIRGKLPFNPFEPKVPADTISQIQKHVEQRMPAFASIKVKNPLYLQVKTRFAVKLKKGYNEGFFKKKLEEELKRYLAPWAYDEGADIVIGGKIYANVIVNFIAERPYVDYVAGIKLFQSEDGVLFKDVRTLNGENVIKANSPDIILVSALTHVIDFITEDGYEEASFSGINYMKIGLDFIVG